MTLQQEFGHNTSGRLDYNPTTFPKNFTSGRKDSDDSFNPTSPAHVSDSDVKALTPGLKVPRIILTTPYDYGGNHRDFGINTKTKEWAAAYCTDMQRRGYTGICIDYYGPRNVEDVISLLLKAQCESMTGFTFSLMLDSTGDAPKNTVDQVASMAYIKATYFPSPAYQKIKTPDGVTRYVILPWGEPLPGVDYGIVLAQTSQFPLYRVWQGPGALHNPNAEAGFDWVQPKKAGSFDANDPYNLRAKQSIIDSFKGQSKGLVLSTSPGFDDTLASWGQKRSLPRDFGKCWLAQNALVAANLMPNVVFIMDATGTDAEEGTALSFGIDNGVKVVASLSGTDVAWTISGGTGDESTLDHYRIIASPDGTNSQLISLVPVGAKKVSLAGLAPGQYTVYVKAVGKGNFIDRESVPVNFSVAAPKPPVTFTIPGIGSGVFQPF